MGSKKSKKAGLPPGSVVFTGNRKVEKITIHYLQYNEGEITEQTLDNQSITAFHHPVEKYIQWYDFRGVHDTALIEEVGKVFRIHPLVLEDIADTYQRPKLDEYENSLFITLKALAFDKTEQAVKLEQVALYLGAGLYSVFPGKSGRSLCRYQKTPAQCQWEDTQKRCRLSAICANGWYCRPLFPNPGRS